MHQQRIHRVMEGLRREGISRALITDPVSIYYMSGYYTEPHERLLALYVADDGDSISTTLFANILFPYPTGAADQIVTFSDTDDAIGIVAKVVAGDTVLGVDKNMGARWLVPLMECGAVRQVRLASFAVDDARSVKDEREREAMRAASLLHDRGMEWLAAQVHEGVTEIEIAENLLGAYRSLGAEGYSFDPIVSFAANAADPHHEPDGTVFKRGDMVLFDVGCKLDDYCADMTRTFFTAKPTERQLLVYDTVRRANEAAEKLVAPGVLFSDIDRCARSISEDAGFGKYFTHRLGHQIGLEVHEPGDVSSAHTEPVQAGQIFSIEPGIYLPGEIGVRIEDLVLVVDGGCEILNHYSKEPHVLEV